MKTSGTIEVSVKVRCPMCNAANDIEIPDAHNPVIRCKYCHREFKFIKKYLSEQIKRWRHATR